MARHDGLRDMYLYSLAGPSWPVRDPVSLTHGPVNRSTVGLFDLDFCPVHQAFFSTKSVERKSTDVCVKLCRALAARARAMPPMPPCPSLGAISMKAPSQAV